MSFTPFIDDLALVELLIGFVAVLLAYVGVLAWWSIRTNNARLLRETLQSAAIPLGAVGAVTLGLAIYVETTWPFLASDGLGGYNIFFGDAMVLMGIVSLAFAAAAYLGRHLHVVGLLSACAGIAVGFYGWTGYTAHPAFTTEPLDTLLLYGAFGVAAIAAFPATVLTDYYLNAVATGRTIWQSASHKSPTRSLRTARAVQGLSASTSSESKGEELSYRVPYFWQIVMLVFPALMVLAAIAAFWYFGVTLPGHLGQGAGNAP